MLAIDVSNHNNLAGELTRAANLGHSAKLVIVRGSLENAGFIRTAKQQCQETLDRGLLLDIYGWAYATADDPVNFAHQLVETYGGFNPQRWWIDCEEDTRAGSFKSWFVDNPARNIEWLQGVVDAFEGLGLLDKLGIYTGHWFWTGAWMGNTDRFAHLTLWNATDTKEPDLNLGWPYGGWTPPYGAVQFDLSGPDLDFMDDALYDLTPAEPAPEEPPEPSPEEVDAVISRLSLLGGIQHDKIPAWILELEAALVQRAAWKGHVETVLAQLREYAVYDETPANIG